jgi:anti-sigma factor RsiW
VTRDELEFSISQYVDGTLVARERDVLDERLATDAKARTLLAEYESLQGVLAAAPMPDVRWEQLAGQISEAVAREEKPAQSYKISAWLKPMRLAIAASVLVAAGITFTVLRPNDVSDKPGTTIAGVPMKIVKVDQTTPGATAVAIANPEAVRVAIVEPAAAAPGEQPAVLRYADSVVQRPSKALIVSAAPVGQDIPQTPF